MGREFGGEGIIQVLIIGPLATAGLLNVFGMWCKVGSYLATFDILRLFSSFFAFRGKGVAKYVKVFWIRISPLIG